MSEYGSVLSELEAGWSNGNPLNPHYVSLAQIQALWHMNQGTLTSYSKSRRLRFPIYETNRKHIPHMISVRLKETIGSNPCKPGAQIVQFQISCLVS